MRYWTVLLLLLLFSPPAGAEDVAPSQGGGLEIPVPRPKPAGLGGKTSAAAPAQQWPSASGKWPADVVAAERTACAAELEGRDIRFSRVEPIGEDGGCGAPAPVEVSTVAGVTLSPPAVITCRMAARLHDWIIADVQPAARKRLKTRVTGINTASSYVCRLRNNAKSGKLSEHGKANALDMSGFTFAKSEAVKVENGWGGILRKIGFSKEGNFLDDIRTGACAHFATVLGPGSDAYHGDHFHIDAIARKNDYRICK